MIQPASLLLLCFLFLESTAQLARYDVLITEVLPDPTPSIGLPEYEFVEIHNRSKSTLNLKGWSLSDPGTKAFFQDDHWIKPDSFLILSSISYFNSFQKYGRAIGLKNFPTLNNDKDTLILRDPTGQVIHGIFYTVDWHDNLVKKEGGWSLQMNHLDQPCKIEGNWSSANHPSGGTPGSENNVSVGSQDISHIRVRELMPIDSVWIQINFNQSMGTDLHTRLFQWNNLQTIGIREVPPLYQSLQLQVTPAMKKENVYQLSIQGIKDCNGEIQPEIISRTALPSTPVVKQVVINEVLFDPPPDGSDYIELYNKGPGAVDLRTLFISQRNAVGILSQAVRVSATTKILLPGEYALLSEDPEWVSRNFLALDTGQYLLGRNLPSMGDDAGNIVLQDEQGNILDEIIYQDDFHHPWLEEKEGVALERLNPDSDGKTNINWYSAASTCRYGTPGYINSQLYIAENLQEGLKISPPAFSPNQDGKDDVVLLEYHLKKPGNGCRIMITDRSGRPVKSLVSLAVPGLKGNFRWEGQDDKGNRVAPGLYLAIMTIYHMDGSQHTWRKSIIVSPR